MRAGWATLQEIETHWSYADLVEANDVLDAVEEAERKATPPPAPGHVGGQAFPHPATLR